MRWMMKIATCLVPLALLAACNKPDATRSAPAIATAPTVAPTSPTSPAAPAAPVAPVAPTRVAISVTENGFEPESVNVPAGKPVTLVFKRVTNKTCAKAIVLTMADGKTIERELPLDTPVELAATFPKAGRLGYACSMDMIKGTVVVQ